MSRTKKTTTRVEVKEENTVFKALFPKAIEPTRWKKQAFLSSPLQASAMTKKVIKVLRSAKEPITMRQLERRVYFGSPESLGMNRNTHVRAIVKKLAWLFPDNFEVFPAVKKNQSVKIKIKHSQEGVAK